MRRPDLAASMLPNNDPKAHIVRYDKPELSF
jgi:hypothetical protein